MGKIPEDPLFGTRPHLVELVYKKAINGLLENASAVSAWAVNLRVSTPTQSSEYHF